MAGAEGSLRLLSAQDDGERFSLGRVSVAAWHQDPSTVRQWQADAREATYMVLDPDLGWTLGSKATYRAPEYLYTTNAQRLRAAPDRLYAPEPAPGTVRIACIGESFTHGDEVSLEDTWCDRLEHLDPRLEVLNFGVPGYGSDQALLRWRKEGAAFRSDFVVLGIWPENICRNLNLVRFWLSPHSGFSPKPRFVLEPEGRLKLVNSPVLSGEDLVAAVTDPQRWEERRYERWFEPDQMRAHLGDGLRLVQLLRGLGEARARHALRHRLYSGEEPEGIALTTAIARQFAADVRATGAEPLVLVMPMRDLLDEWPGEDDLPLVRSLRQAGLTVVNLFPAARSEGGAAFVRSGHLSPRGQQMVAREVFAAARKVSDL